MDCNQLLLQAKTFLNRSQTSLHHDKNFSKTERIIKNLCGRLENMIGKSDTDPFHLAVDDLFCHDRKTATNERKMSSATERSVHFGSMILSVGNNDTKPQHLQYKWRETVVFFLLKAIPHLLLFIACLLYIIASYYLLCSIDNTFSMLSPFEVYPLLVNSYLRPGILTARPREQSARAAFSVMIVFGIAFLSALTGNIGRVTTEAYCFLKPKVVKLVYDTVIPCPQRIDFVVLLYALTLFNILAIIIYNFIYHSLDVVDVFYFL
ncbi:unnamed protein product [Bursaphelenchus xylophilus]|uniref:(pine wood nematode) hypothetical protein n=1 Tax=Bursaphelenchus xylophilus TaxID=6326 RepID=A0A1I7SFM6_BURXY|nr:unnamed protein product [Bursaphelenchus xylophilus]CAG9112954.1 unnamed protein product [Bursaphelenchus xylophilus]